MGKDDKPSFKLDDRSFEEIFAEWEGVSLRKSKLLNQNKGRLPSAKKEEVSSSSVQVRSFDKIFSDWEKSQQAPRKKEEASNSKANVRSMDQILKDWELSQNNVGERRKSPKPQKVDSKAPVNKIDIPSMESLFGKGREEEEVEDGAVIYTRRKPEKKETKPKVEPVASKIDIPSMESLFGKGREEEEVEDGAVIFTKRRQKPTAKKEAPKSEPAFKEPKKGPWISFVADARLDVEDNTVPRCQALIADFLYECKANDQRRISIKWANEEQNFAYRIKNILVGFGLREKNIHLVRSSTGACFTLWAILNEPQSRVEVRPMEQVFSQWEQTHQVEIKDDDKEPEKKLNINALRRMAPMATLDLHNHTSLEAQIAIKAFLKECREKGFVKFALIVGKGLHSPGEPIMETVARQVLSQESGVREIGKAPRANGGSGVLWVILKG